MNAELDRKPMAIIDTPGGERYYFIEPPAPGSYAPTIAVINGQFRACYVIPELLGVGSVYSEGTAKVYRKHRDLHGIRAALEIMHVVWSGVLETHPGAPSDLAQQERLGNGLVGAPEAAYALIEKSGKLGTAGIPQKAANYARNITALAHWGAVWRMRTRSRKNNPGIAWHHAAAFVNQRCHEAFPDIGIRQWEDFTGGTGGSLKRLMDAHGLSAKLPRPR